MPSLPPDLERLIFEIAALQDTNHNNRIQIILVAKRVYEWIQPILYRVVVIRNTLLKNCGALTIRNLRNPQITNSARFVRHLAIINRNPRELLEIISTFPNLEDLQMWGLAPEVYKKLNDLPLRRLSLYLGFLSLPEAFEHYPAFKNLTHLELLHLNALITNSARYVRHLTTVNRNPRELLEIISTFPNVENLQMWIATPELLKKLNDLPLRRLSLYLGHSSLPEAIEHCPAFKNLTHLELISLKRRPDDRKALKELPKLTHLSFTFLDYQEDEFVMDLLKHCASLRVLMSITRSTDWHKVDDPRYLVLRAQLMVRELLEEWARSANGLIGWWELAEVIIEARKANLFKDTCPYVLSRKTWMEHLNDDGERWYKEWSRRFRN